jgi:isopenicillin-N epimerase
LNSVPEEVIVEKIRVARRTFLERTGLALAASTVVSCQVSTSESRPSAASLPTRPDEDEWLAFRQQFRLNPDFVHMSALLIASHPKPVAEAIERYRDELDTSPVLTLIEHNRSRRRAVRAAAAAYLGTEPEQIALTDSTTMGIGLMYNGLRLRGGDELLASEQEYYVTAEALRQASGRSGATVRLFPLYDDLANVSVDGLVERVASAIRPASRVLATTWVHSSTGLKVPIARLADVVRDVNASRAEADRLWLCVDGVHGFGVEDAGVDDLGCDLLAAGCHKWLFGPRGTGILWGSTAAWASVEPFIPSFTDDDAWGAWMEGGEVQDDTTAARMSPGGFKAFEHQWALEAAFELHRSMGRAAVAARTHALARRLKEGLAGVEGVRVVTPMSPDLSSGIVCFDVEGQTPQHVVRRLRDARIIASVTPYAERHVRVTPSARNTDEEVDAVVEAVRELA